MRKKHPDIEKVLFDEERIKAKVVELALQIDRDYKDKNLLLIGVLKGSVIFLSDLMREISLDCEIDFVSVSSYVGEHSTGLINMLLDVQGNIEGKDLLIVEDIIDTGTTLHALSKNLKMRKARSLEVCALLDKSARREKILQPKYVGFSVPDEFVVGYGLDFNEKYRTLSFIGVLKKEIIR